MTEPRIVPPEEARALVDAASPALWTAKIDWAAVGSGSDSVIHGYVHTECQSCGEQVDGDAEVAMSVEDVELVVAAPDLAHTAAVLGEQRRKVLAVHKRWAGLSGDDIPEPDEMWLELGAALGVE